MTRIERYIYDLVRFFPTVKKSIVKVYQFLFSIIPQKPVKSDFQIIAREGYFFGFHDKCPWSSDNKYLLAHKIKFDLRMPSAKDEIEIGIFKGENFDEFIPLNTTKTWNWQMGSMLQWISNDNIIYNDFDGTNHISKIIDKNGDLINKYDKPIAAICPDGSAALSYSFVRLRRAAPAYGYANGDENSVDDVCPKSDGLYLIDLRSGETKMLFSLADIASKNNPKREYHYFSHCLFSPSGDRFAFYHRWLENDKQTWTRLYTCNIDGTDMFEFEFSGVVTHLAWQDENHLLSYGLKQDIGDHYYLLKDKTNDFNIIGENSFSSDGHPQFSPDGKFIITDSYPDRNRRQYLTKFELKNEQKENIAILKSPLKFIGDVRCDLHPRWDRNGNYVCFDSAHTGVRSLCTIKL